MAKPKEFHKYLIDSSSKNHVTQEDYLNSPACAFLKYVIEAKDAVELCKNKFPKNQNGTYSSDSLASIQHITAAMIPAIMGHFETFQRYLFAGMFENSVYLQKFDVGIFLNNLKKEINLEIDVARLSSYRGSNISVGLLLADNLNNWQWGEKVNKYFGCFGLKNAAGHTQSFYSNDDKERSAVLWQLRNSIVHTGGTITRPDAQKVKNLHEYGDKQIVFQNTIIYEIARKLHPLIKNSTFRMKDIYLHNLRNDIEVTTRKKIEDMFKVSSTASVWLR